MNSEQDFKKKQKMQMTQISARSHIREMIIGKYSPPDHFHSMSVMLLVAKQCPS